jgi:hypothetical protein
LWVITVKGQQSVKVLENKEKKRNGEREEERKGMGKMRQ